MLFAAAAGGVLWAFPVPLLMYYGIDKLIGPRADTLDAQRGLGFTDHNKIA